VARLVTFPVGPQNLRQLAQASDRRGSVALHGGVLCLGGERASPPRLGGSPDKRGCQSGLFGVPRQLTRTSSGFAICMPLPPW
jgi:hypothetical protein